jgi:serine/threonine-protein kinase
MRLAGRGSLAKAGDEYRLQKTPPVTAAEREAVSARTKQIAGFLGKIARAVEYIHQRGILHRDLKPGNILLDESGEPLVADFGLGLQFGPAVIEESGTTAQVGTPGYLAPEQVQPGTDLTPAVDVWGVGAVLYELLTGQTPFVGTTVTELTSQAADPKRTVPPPSLYNRNVKGSDLELICNKCLAKDPSKRYATAAELADDLEHCAEEEETSVRPWSPLERGTRWVVKAVNKKLMLDGIARWSAIDFWDAGLNLLLSGVLFALIRADRPPAELWLAQLTFVVVWWWVFLTYFFRNEQPVATERNLALLWAGVTLANVTLFWLHCPPFGSGRAADLLAYYPPWTVVNGLAFLVVGRLYWGRYYLIGLAHFLVALLMPLCRDLAPLVYGVFVAICMCLGGVDHNRAALRQADGK